MSSSGDRQHCSWAPGPDTSQLCEEMKTEASERNISEVSVVCVKEEMPELNVSDRIDDHNTPPAVLPKKEDDPDEDYLYCEACKSLVFKKCEVHGPPLFIPDTPVPMGVPDRARQTLPPGLELGKSSIPEAGVGVFNNGETVPVGAHFGPYEGELVDREEAMNSRHSWVKVNPETEKKKRAPLSIEMKQEMIKKYERGMRLSEIAKEYGRNPSTIGTILKQKDTLKATTPSKGLSVISKRRSSLNDEMERLLLLWIKEKEIAGDTVTQAIISQKAAAIFSDLVKEGGGEGSSNQQPPKFKASHGWFDRFKRRTGIHSVIRHFEASSSDQKAAEEFIKKFEELVVEEGYIPQQVFNCDETGLFWKKMPRRTFITAEEKTMPGHKPMKDRLTLALCSNASGDCKIKPLLVYHSENPRAFKAHKILKERLNVMWRANAKAWVTRQFFFDWVNLVFGPSVKKFLEENNLPLKCLLVLDNAPAHPPGLEDDILDEFSFIKVLFLPPNATPLLQPMDQQVIANFKKLYTKFLFKTCFDVTKNTQLTLREFWKHHFNIVVCLKLIEMAWQGVTTRTLGAAWRKLWPHATDLGDFKVEGEPQPEPEVDEIMSLGKAMGLDVDEEDIDDLVTEHQEELSTEELKELEAMRHSAVREEFSTEKDEEEAEIIPSAQIKDVLAKFHYMSDFVEKHHPDKVFTTLAISNFDDVCLVHFRNIMKSRQRQTSLDQYFTKRSSASTAEGESQPKKKKSV